MESVIKSIVGCARCHGDGHDDLLFNPFTYPVKAGRVERPDKSIVIDLEATHWALCPTNGEPILMAFTTIDKVAQR